MIDPYQNQLLNTASPCAAHFPVPARLVCILHARAEARGLNLAPFPSRAVLKHEVHELIVTAEEAAPGKLVNRISYLAFFEVLESGILWSGDTIQLGDNCLGQLAGYDMTHMPNHMNIIVRVGEPLKTGLELGLQLGQILHFKHTSQKGD
jgi:hypothetical protein